MKFWLSLHGRETAAEVQESGGRITVEIDGRHLEADFRALPDGEVYSLLVDGRSHEVSVSAGPDSLEVRLRGRVHPVEVRHPLEKALRLVSRRHRHGGGGAIVAPMPGLVVAVQVRPGDRVTPGAPVAVVEAMKMQNQLSAHGEGVVREVRVQPGQSVEAGQVLVMLATEKA